MAGIGPDPIKESLKKRIKAGGVDKVDPEDNTSFVQPVFTLKLKGK